MKTRPVEPQEEVIEAQDQPKIRKRYPLITAAVVLGVAIIVVVLVTT